MIIINLKDGSDGGSGAKGDTGNVGSNGARGPDGSAGLKGGQMTKDDIQKIVLGKIGKIKKMIY